MEKNFENEIFRSDFPLDGPHLIAASAGTGKTHQLQNIYARLILEKGLRVPEILVMTFTKASTGELKERICAVLKDLKQRLSLPFPPPPATRQEERADLLIACALGNSPDRRLLAQRVELALLEFDNAAIFTIHGFCQRVLIRYAFETGFSFGAEIDNNQKGAALARLSLDWWLRAAPEEKGDGKLEDLRKAIRPLSSKSDWTLEKTESDLLLLQAQKIVRKYDSERMSREKMSYDDLLTILRDALRSDSGELLAGKLRQEYRAALIDEFQDTDPVQYEIFRKLFLQDKDHPLFLVGDPKQAIYSFRGGDIFTYRQAVRDLPPERKYELTGNFRTTERLMQAINALFLDRDGDFTFGTPDIPYQTEIEAKGEHPQLLDNGKADYFPFQVIRTEDTGKIMADEIVRTLCTAAFRDKEGKETKISPGDIAVLTFSNRNASDIGEILRQRGVPCVLEKTGNLFARGKTAYREHDPGSALAHHFLSLFYAVVRNGEKKPLLRALFTPFFGFSPAELLTITPEILAEWTENFRELNRIWNRSGFAAFLARLETLGKRNGVSLYERLAATGDHGRTLFDYQEMIELCFQAISEAGRRPENLLQWWETRLTQIDDEEEAFKRKAESDGDAVRIMTMHAAKGLQFPVVFVPVNGFPAPRAPFSYHDDGEKLVFSSKETHPLIAKEESEEKMRLLYVALTRAENRCVILCPVDKAPSQLQKLLDQAASRGAGPENADSPIAWRSLPPTGPSEPELIWIPPAPADMLPAGEPRIFDLRPLKGSYSSLQGAGSGKAEDEKDRDREWENFNFTEDLPALQNIPIFQIRGGAAAGNCWHDILEKIPFDTDEPLLLRQAEHSLYEYGFSPAMPLRPHGTVLSATVEMVRRTLSFPLTAPDGSSFSLREIPWSWRLSEQEFEFSSAAAVQSTAHLAEILARHWKDQPEKQEFLSVLGNWDSPVPHGFFTGFIDLLFRHGDFYYIVDWKSNSLKEERRRRTGQGENQGDPLGFDRTGIRHEMASHWYFLQYLFYSVVLQKLLKQSLDGQYRWEKHFGGIRYLFLRGIAAGAEEPFFADRPDAALLNDLERAFGLEKY